MPLTPQPRSARGTVGHPYSALNLRLVLAAFGAVVATVFAVLTFLAGQEVFAAVLAVLALVAVVDLVVITLRRRARSRSDGQDHSLFE